MSTETRNQWRLGVLGFVTAWWLALTPWLCGWLWRASFVAPLPERVHEAVSALCVMLWVACLGLALDNVGVRDAAWARMLARWFLIGVLMLPVLLPVGHMLQVLDVSAP
jgi:hypothetical protein